MTLPPLGVVILCADTDEDRRGLKVMRAGDHAVEQRAGRLQAAGDQRGRRMTDGVLFEVTAEHIAVVTFNRPQARNALVLTAMRRFSAVVDEIAARCVPAEGDAIRAVILTGAGRDAFCSGGDLLDLRVARPRTTRVNSPES